MPGESNAVPAVSASGGAALVFMANSLPDDCKWKLPLLMLTPALAVTFNGLATWCVAKLFSHMEEREIGRTVPRILSDIRSRVADKATSDEHRRRLLEKLDEIEKLVLEREIERVRK